MTSLIVFVFDESRKIENCNQFSIFVFRPKYPKSFAIDMTKVPQGEGVLGSNRGRVAWIRSWPPPPSPVVSRRFATFSVVSSLNSVVLSIMASSKTFDVGREGKNLRLRIAAADVTVSRLSRAFQAGRHVVYSTWLTLYSV